MSLNSYSTTENLLDLVNENDQCIRTNQEDISDLQDEVIKLTKIVENYKVEIRMLKEFTSKLHDDLARQEKISYQTIKQDAAKSKYLVNYLKTEGVIQ